VVTSQSERLNIQRAPFPLELEELVLTLQLRGRTGWTFTLGDEQRDEDSRGGRGDTHGLTFGVLLSTRDTQSDGFTRVLFSFPVPPATYDRRSWRRWLFERVRDVELHELMEAFEVNGEVPYAPSHGPGNDPYMVRELGTEVDQRTSWRGDLNPE
jgi:hypothetical protein